MKRPKVPLGLRVLWRVFVKRDYFMVGGEDVTFTDAEKKYIVDLALKLDALSDQAKGPSR